MRSRTSGPTSDELDERRTRFLAKLIESNDFDREFGKTDFQCVNRSMPLLDIS